MEAEDAKIEPRQEVEGGKVPLELQMLCLFLGPMNTTMGWHDSQVD